MFDFVPAPRPENWSANANSNAGRAFSCRSSIEIDLGQSHKILPVNPKQQKTNHFGRIMLTRGTKRVFFFNGGLM